jgi:hypothetical protein
MLPQAAQHMLTRKPSSTCGGIVEDALNPYASCIALAGNYNQLYSTQLLHKAASSPGLVAACLACDPDNRRRDWIEAVRQLALLLPKYDFAFPCSTPGDVTSTVTNSVSNNKGSTAKQKVDGLVDEVTMRVLVCGLLDPPPVVLYDLMVNLERGEVRITCYCCYVHCT